MRSPPEPPQVDSTSSVEEDPLAFEQDLLQSLSPGKRARTDLAACVHNTLPRNPTSLR
jgi:hypothetical protein